MAEAIDLGAALEVAEAAARRSGELLRSAHSSTSSPIQVELKSAIEVVTEFDKQSEALIASALTGAFPTHHIIGEEGIGHGAPMADAAYRWHVDPIDGTTNFARGLPHYCISIALSDTENRPLAGVVYDPVRDELFKAVRGGGAFLNERPIRVSGVKTLASAVVSSGFPYDRWVNADNNTEEWTHFVLRAQATRRMGAAALELCYVACGRLDGHWEQRMKTWDIMAGLLLVSEAGGMITDYHGRAEKLYDGQEVVASNGLIHDDMLAVIVLGSAAPRPRKGG